MKPLILDIVREIVDGIHTSRKLKNNERISELESLVCALREEIERIKFVERRRLEQRDAAHIRAQYEKDGY